MKIVLCLEVEREIKLPHLDNRIALRETALPIAPSYSSNAEDKRNVTLIFKSDSDPTVKNDIALMLLRILRKEFEHE